MNTVNAFARTLAAASNLILCYRLITDERARISASINVLKLEGFDLIEFSLLGKKMWVWIGHSLELDSPLPKRPILWFVENSLHGLVNNSALEI